MRSIFPMIVFSTLCILAAGAHVCFANEPTWLPLIPAIRHARHQARLVMIVQAPGKLTEIPEDSSVANTYLDACGQRSGATGVPQFPVVWHYRSMGTATKKPGSSSANVITYYCLPTKEDELEVIHFFVGFPSRRQFQADTNWAVEYVAKLADLLPNEWRELAASLHSQQLYESNEENGRRVTKSTTVNSTLVAAFKERNELLLRRFGNDWAKEEQPKLLNSIKKLADADDKTAHFFLAHYPLIAFKDLEATAFQTLTNQRVVRESPQIKWCLQQRRRDRPLLLIASPNLEEPPSFVSFRKRSWQPKRNSLSDLLNDFDTLELSRRDIVSLALDLGLTPPQKKASNRWRFIVIERESLQAQFLGDSESSLGRAMKRSAR